MDLKVLSEKYNENPNLRGAIRDITPDAPLEPSEVIITAIEEELLKKHFIQADRANIYLEWQGIKNADRYPTFESYIRNILNVRAASEKLKSLRRELDRQQEEERMRF